MNWVWNTNTNHSSFIVFSFFFFCHPEGPKLCLLECILKPLEKEAIGLACPPPPPPGNMEKLLYHGKWAYLLRVLPLDPTTEVRAEVIGISFLVVMWITQLQRQWGMTNRSYQRYLPEEFSLAYSFCITTTPLQGFRHSRLTSILPDEREPFFLLHTASVIYYLSLLSFRKNFFPSLFVVT